MNRLTLTLPDELYSRLTQRALEKEKTPEEIALERLRREFGEDFLDSQMAKEQASHFLHGRAGRCLTVREPILEETDTPVWLVPVITNVGKREAAFVGQIVINAKTGEVLNEEQDVVEMIKKGRQSLGFHEFPFQKRERLAELLTENQERFLTEDEQKEMENLLAEEQSLQIRNLEELEKTGKIEGLTPIGRATAEVLCMSYVQPLAARWSLIRLEVL